jgi:hypothetical protein
MKKILFILLVSFFSILNLVKAETRIATITVGGSYSFGNSSLWLPNGIPVAGDIAIININLTLNSSNLTVTINNGLNLDNAISKGSLIINNNTNLSTNPLFPSVSVTTIINGLILANNTLQDGIAITNYGTASNTIYFNNSVTSSNMTITNYINGGRLNVRLGGNITVNNMTINNSSSGLSKTLIVNPSISSTAATLANVQILGNLVLQSPGGNNSEFANSTSTTIYGNVILGTSNQSEGRCIIGKSTLSSLYNQTYNLYGDLILNLGGVIAGDHTVFNFNKAGIQKISNNTIDINYPLQFESINIGTTNATTLIFDTTSSNPFAYLSNYSNISTGITIGSNSILDLPRNYTTGIDYSFNTITASSVKTSLNMLPNSKLRIGGTKTEAASSSPGVFGSNFPSIRDNDPNPTLRGTYNLDPTSTIEYYGDCTIAQTIHSGVPYAILLVTNPTGSGCKASKIISNPTTIAKRFDAATNTEIIVGASLDINK